MQKISQTIGRFVAIPFIPQIDVKSIDDVLKQYSRGHIPFYIIFRHDKFDRSIKETCKIYKVLENGILTLQTDNYH